VHIYEFGNFRLDTKEKQLIKDGSPVSLTPKAFDMLSVLVENRGRLLEKAELLELVWPESFVEEANLSVKMSEVRRALGEGPTEDHYIQTVPRRGYRFVAEVKELDDAPHALESASTPVGNSSKSEHETTDETASPTMRTGILRRWPLLLGAALLAGGLIFGFFATGLGERWSDKTGSTPISSIAVLPLEDLSSGEAEAYFADGMTEALITDLAKISALRVISRHSVMRYKTERRPLSEIGRELNVDAVLTGSVSRSGGRVRVAVQLVEPGSGRNLWADSYEQDLRDVLSLQNAIAKDVAEQIRIKLTPQEQTQFAAARPVDPDAYDHYLRGKFYLHRQTRENNDAAIAALETAVAADPTFAAARSELAQGYVWKLFLFDPDNKALAERAFVEAEKALTLDPNLAAAYLARGRLLWTPANRFPHDKAIREYRRALELDPNLDEARNQLALVYNHIGAFDKALRELERAVETNPSNSLAQFRIGETYLFQERYEEALAALRGVPSEVNPGLVGHQIVWALFNLGRKEEAAAAIEKYLAEFPDVNRGLFTSQQAVLAAAAGNERLAEEKIRLAIEKGRGFGHFHHSGYHIAVAYSLMNKPEPAMKWLETVAEEGFPCYPLFERDKNLINLRNDPRFAALMSRLKKQWGQYTVD
jgi:TolB-like protein/DNA-binding winged helix-turn-helix (wHTH) protein/Tfp pilus assembly protein PilF